MRDLALHPDPVMAEHEQVAALMESIVDGERTVTEVCHILEINLEVIDRAANRMVEQRLGLPAHPPADVYDECAREFFKVMRRKWE